MIKYLITKIKFFFSNRIDKSMKQGVVLAKNVVQYDYFPGNTKLKTKNYFSNNFYKGTK